MAHTVIGLIPGEWYHVRIRLVTNRGDADSEKIVMVKAGLPKPVTNLSVSNVTRTTADLSWTLPPITPASPRERELKVQQRGTNGDWTTVQRWFRSIRPMTVCTTGYQSYRRHTL